MTRTAIARTRKAGLSLSKDLDGFCAELSALLEALEGKVATAGRFFTFGKEGWPMCHGRRPLRRK